MKLFFSTFFISTSLYANILCDSPLMAPLGGIEQVSCSDCACVVSAHSESIKSLQAERASIIKKSFVPILKSNTNAILSSIKETAIVLNLSNSESALNQQTLDSCGLDQIKKIQCAGATNADHLKSLFGVSSLDGIVNELKNDFEKSTATKNSCFTESESKLIQVASNLIGNFSSVLIELSSHQEVILKGLSEGKNFTEIIKNIESTKLSKILGITSNPLFSSIIHDSKIMSELFSRREDFLSKPQELGNYLMFSASKGLNHELLNQSIKDSCSNLMTSIQTAICSEDRVAQSFYPDGETPAPTLNELTGYDPTMHDPSYDAEMAELVDDPSKSITEGSYVGHLFWCSAKECSQKAANDACHKMALSKEENHIFADFLANENVSREQNNRKNTYQDNLGHLCSLADCRHKPEGEQQSCAKAAQDKMGDVAGVSVAALDVLTSLESRNNTATRPGDNYTPYTEVMARLEHASMLERAVMGVKNESSPVESEVVAAASTTQDEAGTNVAEQKTTKKATAQKQRTGTNPVVNHSTQSSNRSRPSFVDQAFRDFMSRIPKTEITPTSSQQVSEIQSQANRSLNNARNTIEDLRENYRQASFDRLNDIYSQIASNSNSNSRVVSDVATASSTIATNRSNPSSQERQNTITTPEQNNLPDSQSMTNRNTAAARATGSVASAKPVRVSTRAGEPVLNVDVNELPGITSQQVFEDGVDVAKPFQLAVRVAEDVYYVPVRPTVVDGRKILEPLLDQLGPNLRAQVLKSPLFADYRKYLLKELVTN